MEAAVNNLGCISNAGLSMWAPFEVKDNIFAGVEVNYLGAVHGMHHALPHLKKSRGQFAAISINRMGVPSHTGYVAQACAGRVCEALRYDLEGTGIMCSGTRIGSRHSYAQCCSADGSLAVTAGVRRWIHLRRGMLVGRARCLAPAGSGVVVPAKLVPWLNSSGRACCARCAARLAGRAIRSRGHA